MDQKRQDLRPRANHYPAVKPNRNPYLCCNQAAVQGSLELTIEEADNGQAAPAYETRISAVSR